VEWTALFAYLRDWSALVQIFNVLESFGWFIEGDEFDLAFLLRSHRLFCGSLGLSHFFLLLFRLLGRIIALLLLLNQILDIGANLGEFFKVGALVIICVF
jgi:hypothetical protein